MTMVDLILWFGSAGLGVLVFSIPACVGVIVLRKAWVEGGKK